MSEQDISLTWTTQKIAQTDFGRWTSDGEPNLIFSMMNVESIEDYLGEYCDDKEVFKINFKSGASAHVTFPNNLGADALEAFEIAMRKML